MSLFIEQQFSLAQERRRHLANALARAVATMAAGFFSTANGQLFGAALASAFLPRFGPGVAGASLLSNFTQLQPFQLHWLALGDDIARRHQKHRAYMHRRSRYLKGHRYPPKAWA